MVKQTGLSSKIIKQWFRNTLFKERQKNKDSPYNFNNPPSTMIINNETEINDKQESEDGEKINDERLDLCLGQA